MTSVEYNEVDHEDVEEEQEDVSEENIDTVNLNEQDPDNNQVEMLADPFEGMVFESLESVKKYYAQYGNERGFPIRTNSSQKKGWRSNETSYVQFVCGRQGVHKKKPLILQPNSKKIIRRNTNTKKCGCKARLRVIRDEKSQWRVSVFDNNHNHKFVTPSKRPRMSVNRVLPECAKSLASRFEEENLPVGKVASVLNGHALGFNERDCYNHLNAARNTKYKIPVDGDATATLAYFKRKSLEDPQFFYNIQTDFEGRAVNFFWVDGRSRAQYTHFGDVVVFDTTYKKNKYEMPFGPFTGVNHHLQSIQFGCGLLLDETEESFIWLFETWLAAMGGRHPVSIITDQDKAMTAAVAKVFPNSHHRFCFWHIESKFPERLSYVYHKKPQFAETLRRCFWWPFRITDFEIRWKKMLDDYELHDHEWLTTMYNMREMWVPVYTYGSFFAGMTTTGRSEGMNSVFKDYFSLTSTLRHFIHKFEKCLENISRRENDEDYTTEHTDRVMDDGSPFILMHAAKVYTRNIYDKFKKELLKAQGDLKIHLESYDSNYNSYMIKSRKVGEHVVWNVSFNLETLEGRCECKRFEFMGIPCRHLLKVFIRHDLDEIPESFLLRRWMKGSNQYRTMDRNGIISTSKDSKFLKIMHGSQLANQLVFEAVDDDEDFKMFVDTLTTLSERFAELKIEREKNHPTTSTNIISEDPPADFSQVLLLDPNISQTKGRRSKKDLERLKRGIETSQERGRKKERYCNGCGGWGLGHDIRKCPNPILIESTEKGKNGASTTEKRQPRKRSTQGNKNLNMNADQVETTSAATQPDLPRKNVPQKRKLCNA